MAFTIGPCAGVKRRHRLQLETVASNTTLLNSQCAWRQHDVSSGHGLASF